MAIVSSIDRAMKSFQRKATSHEKGCGTLEPSDQGMLAIRRNTEQILCKEPRSSLDRHVTHRICRVEECPRRENPSF